MLPLCFILALCVIFVNGWTDAPNAIATCVSSRAIGLRGAVLLAAVFNFIGVSVMTILNPAVAVTVYTIADFGGLPHLALPALCAALSAIVIWALAAWKFGIPTSESHALIAGLSGAAIALQGGIEGLNAHAWYKVLWGLPLSVFPALLAGWLLCRILARLCRRCDRLSTERHFCRAQIAASAAMAFMHGAQDGQKFMAVFLLASALSRDRYLTASFTVPLPLMLLCSAVMALGTLIGGGRIIRSVGVDMVRLRPYQGFAADAASALCLLGLSLVGLPAGTTHTKTCAVMGAGAGHGLRRVNWNIALRLMLAWICTFPGCGVLGFLCAKIFLQLS